MDDATKNQLLRRLPSVERLLSSDLGRDLGARYGRVALRRAARRAVDGVRNRLIEGGSGAPSGRAAHTVELEVEKRLSAELAAQARPDLRKVINATGIVLHTGLGRAPLARAARRQLLEIASGYSNLELDLDSGERGLRHAPLAELLTALTGAEAALVVNNCAGAVLLVLSALAADRGAVVSRGELVEIGGGFRMPEVMALGGVRLIEVGTTNKTRPADYARALGPDTALVIKVHRSNFAMSGFTEETSLRELAALARRRSIPLFYDLGSGLLGDGLLAGDSAGREPTVASALREGASLVAFSADKLLGGPQAGVLVGRHTLIRKLQKHPLQRALRIDKLTAAAMEATLRLYRDAREDEIPLRQMLRLDGAELRRRAEELREAIAVRGVPPSATALRAVVGKVGGGSLPERDLPSIALALHHPSPGALSRRLRRGSPAVVARVNAGGVLFDLRTVLPGELASLADAISRAFVEASGAFAEPTSLLGSAHA
jgi:L-seryl-tRNA(Ser) seleniumtransferase